MTPEERVEVLPNWYVVWYWEDEETFTRQFFDDYEDAIQFAKETHDFKH